MKKITFLFYFLATFYSSAQGYSTGTISLNNAAGVAMTAKIDVNTLVTLTLTGPSNRWFALGFGASSMTAGTDVVVCHANTVSLLNSIVLSADFPRVIDSINRLYS